MPRAEVFGEAFILPWRPCTVKLGHCSNCRCRSVCLLRFGDLEEGELRRHDGASSDGYLAHVFRHAAKELFNEDVGEVTYRALRCVGAAAGCACAQCCLGTVPKASVFMPGGCPVYRAHTTQDPKALFVFVHRLPNLDWKCSSSHRRR